MLKPAKGNVKPPLYKIDIYKGQKKNKWDIQKVIGHKDINRYKWYKVKQTGYNKITQKLKENLKNVMRKVKEYYKKTNQAKKGRTNQGKTY